MSYTKDSKPKSYLCYQVHYIARPELINSKIKHISLTENIVSFVTNNFEPNSNMQDASTTTITS